MEKSNELDGFLKQMHIESAPSLVTYAPKGYVALFGQKGRAAAAAGREINRNNQLLLDSTRLESNRRRSAKNVDRAQLIWSRFQSIPGTKRTGSRVESAPPLELAPMF